MKIISIHPGHNSTVAYFEDSVCRMVLHEEKLNNIKNFVGFPKLSLKYLMEKLGIDEIDYVAFVADYYLNFCSPVETGNIVEKSNKTYLLRKTYNFLEYRGGLRKPLHFLRNFAIRKIIAPKVEKEFKYWLKEEYGIDEKKLVFSDHHYLHALTPVFFYGIKNKTLIFTLDGEGDGYCAKIFIFFPEKNKLEEISSSDFSSSIGNLYSKITEYLGMKPTEHEYKVMGLAAYVSNDEYFNRIYDKLKKIIWFDKESLSFRSKFNINVAEEYLKANLTFERFDNIAAAVQKLTEALVVEWIKTAIKKTGIHQIALSGGVFMNVKLNQRISELQQVKKAYFQPTSSDESAVLGAAKNILMKNNVHCSPISSMFLGIEYSNDEVEKYLNKQKYFKKYKIEYVDDIEEKTALLLSKNQIVARLKGAGEWGARSLGNRSILGNSSRMETYFEVNDSVKMRDFWMPFAPTILDSWAEKYIKNWKSLKNKISDSGKFMIVTFDATDLAVNHLRAAMHQKDKTIRPQILSINDNPDMYRLLKKYEKYTGMGGLLNTSFNLHGYPLCATVEQAMFTFENSKLQYLTLENWLISK